MDRNTRSDAKRLDIVTRAFDRFYTGGFHATGIDALMADSGISKRTLYKYFTSKEDLIEAVLDHYGQVVANALFEPVLKMSDDPRQQLIACFDLRKTMMDASPARGCLGFKAAQEYLGTHEGIASRGRSFGVYVERKFVDMCMRARFVDAESLGKQINVLFQGAVLMSQIYGDSSPFVSAKTTLLALMDAPLTRSH